MTKTFKRDNLEVEIAGDAEEMGIRAAQDVAGEIVSMLKTKDEVNMIFAAAPSQETFLKALLKDERIDWTKINAFHMDEYAGMSSDAPQSFVNFLKVRIFDRVPFKSVECLDGRAADEEKECQRYTKALDEKPVDIVCLGIGENGHIAFNDPPVADFNDEKIVKVVKLDEVCRQQQVNEKCFEKLSDVPTHAFTLTIPALMRAKAMFCIVPFAGKAAAVKRTIEGEISTKCPATILRTKPGTKLYLEKASAGLLA